MKNFAFALALACLSFTGNALAQESSCSEQCTLRAFGDYGSCVEKRSRDADQKKVADECRKEAVDRFDSCLKRCSNQAGKR